jgi:DNA mismatch endonuclease (patch repair protein)
LAVWSERLIFAGLEVRSSVRVTIEGAEMADNRTPESRSALMSRIGSKDTAPEMVIRKLLFSMGYRYRLHRSDLPGRPDIVFVRRRKAIFVHGCFWHAHGCKIGRLPKSRVDFWRAKLERNAARDAENERALRGQGWDVLTLWQCETKNLAQLREQVSSFLGG